MGASNYCMVTTTTDNQENADLITQTLLQEKLVSCVQVSSIESSYRWKGKIITSKEIRLEIKTNVSLFAEIKETIEKIHTYDVPEILMFIIDDAKPDYLRWIDGETKN
ncbi:MAG: divalent-cation tolerance protein CutA [Sulfurovum sp.]|nr:divalent-cation tolerance protein CutA [Sulfurovum sp.]MCB4745449.1 divalent-cation tolerance protein CutA [Sulfurovum sp.]MCB4745650.1 divalent-cation tolerance protein CutA [Sulfurovum sp.]MCB4748381.1 divalent-cation tolerance protein CutA [Sulfurovum sp.]MCB4749040.1 divalent-cation tolerance protein CutA [Sulfurovum sp.]